MWALFILNLAIRRDERSDDRALLGDRLLDAIRERWGTSVPKP